MSSWPPPLHLLCTLAIALSLFLRGDSHTSFHTTPAIPSRIRRSPRSTIATVDQLPPPTASTISLPTSSSRRRRASSPAAEEGDNEGPRSSKKQRTLDTPSLPSSSSSSSEPTTQVPLSSASSALSTAASTAAMVSASVPATGAPPAVNGHSSTTSSTSADIGFPPPSAVANGHPSTSNGFGASAGSGSVAAGKKPARETDAMQYEGEEGFVPLWEGSNFDRREFVRLALQAFEDMGYSGTAQALQAESGFALEDPAVTQFRQCVLAGQWEEVERLLSVLPVVEADLTPIKFAVRRQKFLEAMEAKETKKALSVLRNELSPLNYDSDQLHFLSSLVMSLGAEDLRARAGWDGAAGTSRQQLLVQLQSYISPSVMLPQHRLGTLLSQAQHFQQQHHAVPSSSSEPFSLLADSDPQAALVFPDCATHVLQEHTDEVWRLAWSHDGEWLATAGKDKTVMLWRVRNGFMLEKVFREHVEAISCLAWSPDDSILLTAAETIIKMWNTETGTCIATLARHEYPIGAVAWLPDGQGFVSGGMDNKIFFWDLAGNVTAHLARCPSRIIDLAVSPSGEKLICVGRADTTEPHLLPSRGSSSLNSRSGTPAGAGVGTGHPPLGARHEKRVSVFGIKKGREAESELLYELVQPQEVTSVAISSDSRYAIVSHGSKEILYLDLDDGTILRKFEGHDQGHFVLRACFGGANENLVLSGTGDGRIYVYHRHTGKLLHTITGHGHTTVNAVAWNFRPPASARGAMWASCSDDRTVRVWEMPPAGAGGDGKVEGARAAPRLRPLERMRG